MKRRATALLLGALFSADASAGLLHRLFDHDHGYDRGYNHGYERGRELERERIEQAERRQTLGTADRPAVAAVAVAPDHPADYAARFTLAIAPGSSLQRVVIPAAALALLQSADAADLRVFNGAGDALPHAFIAASGTPSGRRIALPAQPLADAGAHGDRPDANASAADAGRSSAGADRAGNRGSNGASNRASDWRFELHEHGDDRRISIASAPVGSAAQAAALIDARALRPTSDDERIAAIDLDISFPPGRPIGLSLDASTDLRHWRSVGPGVVLYRPTTTAATPAPGAAPSSPPLPPPNRIELNPPQPLGGDWLRLSWPVDEDVGVRGITLITRRAPTGPDPVDLPLGPPRRDADGNLVFSTGFATPIDALDLTLDLPDSLVPLRIEGRRAPAAPWLPLASGTAWFLRENGRETRNAPFALHHASAAELRIVANPAPGALAESLRVTARVAPLEIVFVATGTPPFTLAAGRRDARATALPLASVMPPPLAADAQFTPPLATVQAMQIDAALATRAPAAAPPDRQRMLLWVVLGASVLLLGAIAWTLLRAPRRPSDDPPDAG